LADVSYHWLCHTPSTNTPCAIAFAPLRTSHSNADGAACDIELGTLKFKSSRA
jgi:hypothetical protein